MMFFENQTYSGDHAQERSFLYALIMHVICKLRWANKLTPEQVSKVLNRLLEDEENHLRGEPSSAIRDALRQHLSSPERLLNAMQQNPNGYGCWKHMDLVSEVSQCKAYADGHLSAWINREFAADLPLRDLLRQGSGAVSVDLNTAIEVLNQFNRESTPALNMMA